MPLQLKNPLAIFDLETTGINIIHDRIIEASFIKIHPNGKRESKNIKINPGMPIPNDSSQIHGIFDRDVAAAPKFKQIAKSLAKFLEGCDLAGFSVIRFDVPMLMEEFLRADVKFDVSQRKIIDAQKIFHLMEKRNLTAAYKFYCDMELTNAHSAEADTQATFEVLEAMVDRYEGQPVLDNLGKQLGNLDNNMQSLHDITNTGMVDFAGTMKFDKDNKEVFNFGKHKGKNVVEVLNQEPSYYDWIMKGEFPLDTKRKLTQIKIRKINNN